MASKDNKKKIIIAVLVLGGLATLAYFLLRKKPKKEQPLKVLRDAFDQLSFEFNKATILPASYPSLDELAQTLNQPEASTWKLKIEGHTDSKGSTDYNMKLSQMRALAVKSYLQSKGISEDRITAFGYGESKPIASNETEEGRAKNRRVEFTVQKPDGTLITTAFMPSSNQKGEIDGNSNSQKINLIISELKRSGQFGITSNEGEQNLKSYLSSIPNPELDKWVAISKIYNDKQITEKLSSSNQADKDVAWVSVMNNYGVSKSEFEDLHKKALNYVVSGK
jgi:hypothetical protein